MRQAGILAAAGIVALEQMVDRLGEDHCRAAALAQGLADVAGIEPDTLTPPTNMVFANLSAGVALTAAQVAARLKEHGVLVGPTGSRRFRMVTHYWIDDVGIDRAVRAFGEVLAAA